MVFMLKKSGKFAALSLAVMIAAVSVNGYNYESDIQVNVAVDGVVTKTFNTKADMVKDVLSAGEFALADGDLVVPGIDVKLMNNATINIKPVKNVEVKGKDATFYVQTNASTTSELAENINYVIGENNSIVDYNTGDNSFLVDGALYAVKDGHNVNVHADYATYPVKIAEGTVADAVEMSGVEIDENDIVIPPLTSKVKSGTKIEVIRVAKTHDTQTVTIPFETEYRINMYLKPGEEVVVAEGREGEMIVDNIITFHDGEAVEYETTESLVRNPENKIVECGVWNVKGDQQNAAGAVGTINGYGYSKVISATATAYCDKGKTASGISSKVGVVAVDPRVIPLGTRLYIESTDGSWSYGVCLAGDTGGLIKGNRVDLFYDGYDECMQFGRRSCNIYVLSD